MPLTIDFNVYNYSVELIITTQVISNVINLAKGKNMPDKIQHTAASMQQKMLARYSDGLSHKHNKHHLEYRQHCRSHPCNQSNGLNEEDGLTGSTGLLRQFKLRKIRKRPDKGHFH